MTDHRPRPLHSGASLVLSRAGLLVLLTGMMLSAMALASLPRALADDPSSSGIDLCAQTAANAGFSGERLVKVVAIGMAESACHPSAQHVNGPTEGCPEGSLDRGLWQINDCYHGEVADDCAYEPQCAADSAYAISSEGSDFAPWVTYRTSSYLAYMDEARDAVDRLTS
jgi:Lysozyme like domain